MKAQNCERLLQAHLVRVGAQSANGFIFPRTLWILGNLEIQNLSISLWRGCTKDPAYCKDESCSLSGSGNTFLQCYVNGWNPLRWWGKRGDHTALVSVINSVLWASGQLLAHIGQHVSNYGHLYSSSNHFFSFSSFRHMSEMLRPLNSHNWILSQMRHVARELGTWLFMLY